MNRQPPGLAERAVHRRRLREPGRRWDPPIGEASNESTKMENGEGRLEAGRWSAASAVTCGPGDGSGAASQKEGAKLRGERQRREEGTEQKTEKKGRRRKSRSSERFIPGPNGTRARYSIWRG